MKVKSLSRVQLLVTPWTPAWVQIQVLVPTSSQLCIFLCLNHLIVGIKTASGDSDGKVSAYNVGDPGSIPGSGRSSGEGNGNPLQYSCLGNPMGRGAQWATVRGVAKSQTPLSTHARTHRPLRSCV